MGKTKYLSAFEQDMVVGARHTSLSVSIIATLLRFSLLGFSLTTVSRAYQEWSNTQKTSSQLYTTVGCIGVNNLVEYFQHLVESMHQLIEAALGAIGGATP